MKKDVDRFTHEGDSQASIDTRSFENGTEVGCRDERLRCAEIANSLGKKSTGSALFDDGWNCACATFLVNIYKEEGK